MVIYAPRPTITFRLLAFDDVHSFSIHGLLIHFVSDVLAVLLLERGRFVHIADANQRQLALLCYARPEIDCQIHQLFYVGITVHLLQPTGPVFRMLIQIGEEFGKSAAASPKLDVSDQLGFADRKGLILVVCAVKSLVRFTGI